MQDAWGNLLDRFQNCKRSLSKWDKEHFKNAARELSKLKKQLTHLLNANNSAINYYEINELKEKIRRLWD